MYPFAHFVRHLVGDRKDVTCRLTSPSEGAPHCDAVIRDVSTRPVTTTFVELTTTTFDRDQAQRMRYFLKHGWVPAWGHINRGSVLSQPAVGGVLVDAAADGGGRRVLASTYSLLRLLQCAARRHRRILNVAGLWSSAWCSCVNRLANAALAARLPNWRLMPVETRPGALAGAADHGHGAVLGVNNFLERQRQDGLAAVADHRPKLLSPPYRRRHPDPMAMLKPFKARDGKLAAVAAGCASAACARPFHHRRRAARLYRPCQCSSRCRSSSPAPSLATAYIGFLSARAIGEEGAFAETADRPLAGAQFELEERRSTSSAWSSASPSISWSC